MKEMEKKNLKNLKNDREYRNFINFEIRSSEENENKEMWVEGYAALYDTPTVLWEWDGVEYKEQIISGAFDGSDMSDVIYLYDHRGKVMARTRNKTLQLTIDHKGLFIKARLDGTKEGRELYEEIKGGYIDRMSFSFKIKEDSYDFEEHMRNIRKFRKIYDVSAVSMPAYEETSISARDYFTAQQELLKKQEDEKRKKRLKLLASC
jgi:HK97 family phage prohead protease